MYRDNSVLSYLCHGNNISNSDDTTDITNALALYHSKER